MRKPEEPKRKIIIKESVRWSGSHQKHPKTTRPKGGVGGDQKRKITMGTKKVEKDQITKRHPKWGDKQRMRYGPNELEGGT